MAVESKIADLHLVELDISFVPVTLSGIQNALHLEEKKTHKTDKI